MAVFGKKAAQLKPGEPRPEGWRGEKCGIPHEFGSTGFGVAEATRVAADVAGLDLKGATVAIHGFGNVGTFAYQYLTEMGASVVALADKSGAIWKQDGFERSLMDRFIEERRELAEFPGAEKITPEKFWSLPVDILIPASVTDVINVSNKDSIQAKIIVEAGNIPMREPIEAELGKRGILIVPDFVANAGGVISSYAEYRGYNPKQMFELVKRKIVKATKAVLAESMKSGITPRTVAMEIAMERVRNAKERKR